MKDSNGSNARNCICFSEYNYDLLNKSTEKTSSTKIVTPVNWTAYESHEICAIHWIVWMRCLCPKQTRLKLKPKVHPASRQQPYRDASPDALACGHFFPSDQDNGNTPAKTHRQCPTDAKKWQYELEDWRWGLVLFMHVLSNNDRRYAG